MPSTPLPDDVFLSEILRQPDVILATTTSLADQTVALAAKLVVGAPERAIVLTGMGSSLYSCWALESMLGRHGILATLIPTSELLHFRWPAIPQGALLLSVTQSGRSIESVRLGELMAAERPDVTVVSVTNGLENPVAGTAHLAVDTSVGPEIGPSTMTVVACLLALVTIERTLRAGGRDLDAVVDSVAKDAEALAAGLRTVLSDPLALVDRMASWYRLRPKLVVLGRGTAATAAKIAALVIKESAGVQCEGFEAANFRHGPLEIAGPSLAAAIVSLEPSTRHLDVTLAEELLGNGTAVLFIGPEGTAPAGCEFVAIAEIDPMLDVASSLAPLQLLAWHLARENGRRPDKMVRASKVTTRE